MLDWQMRVKTTAQIYKFKHFLQNDERIQVPMDAYLLIHYK